VILEAKVASNPAAMRKTFEKMPSSRIALETGTHSPWLSRLLTELGHEAIVAHARNVRLIGESRRKDDRLDAQALARLARIDPKLLSPIQHRSAQAQADLSVIRARYALVRARTALVCAARGLTKSFGDWIRGRSPKGFSLATSEALSPSLQVALAPLLSAFEAITARIRDYDAQIEKLAEESYPETALLKQVKGVGTLIALTYVLTLEDPRRFRKSRDAGCFVGLQPGRRNSGQSEPQMHITREGDSYLRMVLVQGAQHIIGAFRRRFRSAPMGTETGRAWWQERKETGHHRCCTQACSFTPPSLDQLRSIRAPSQHTKAKTRSSIALHKLERTTRNVEFRRLRGLAPTPSTMA